MGVRRPLAQCRLCPKGLIVVALKLFGNKLVFELANLLGRQNRILLARDHAPFQRLSFFVPLICWKPAWISDPFRTLLGHNPMSSIERYLQIRQHKLTTTANPLDLLRLPNSLNL